MPPLFVQCRVPGFASLAETHIRDSSEFAWPARGGSASEANQAFEDLIQLPMQLYPFEPFAARVWELRARDNSDYMARYPGATTTVDAYLDVVVKDYGYMAAGLGSSNPYRPFLFAQCRLVRASDSSVLMQDVVALNPLNGGTAKTITLSPDPEFYFPGFGDIEAAPKEAADGVGRSLAQTTGTLGTLLN